MKKYSVLSLILAFLAAACTPPSTPLPTSLTAWIDAPLDGSTIPLDPYQIVAHSSDPSQITRIEISVDGVVMGVVENPDPADLLLTARISWTPPAPGSYLLEARGQNSSGEWSSFAQSRVTVQEEIQTQPALVLLPTSTPDLELTICEPEISAIMNTTCRQGPTTFNQAVAYLEEGESASLLGGNRDSSWWAILPESQSSYCWVSGQTVNTTCLPEEVDILDTPPYITRVFPSLEEFYWGDHHLRSVTIQVQSGGEIPVTGVRLIYHLSGKSDWYNTAMIRSEGEIWKAEIQAQTFKNYRDVSSSIVEYYLEAENEAGLVTKTPIYNNLKLKEVP